MGEESIPRCASRATPNNCLEQRNIWTTPQKQKRAQIEQEKQKKVKNSHEEGEHSLQENHHKPDRRRRRRLTVICRIGLHNHPTLLPPHRTQRRRFITTASNHLSSHSNPPERSSTSQPTKPWVDVEFVTEKHKTLRIARGLAGDILAELAEQDSTPVGLKENKCECAWD